MCDDDLRVINVLLDWMERMRCDSEEPLKVFPAPYFDGSERQQEMQ